MKRLRIRALLIISTLIISLAQLHAAEPRHFMMTLAGIQAKARAEPFYQLAVDPALIAADADAVTVVVEGYGIPWEVFANSEAPPEHLWTNAMREMASSMKATGKPLVLQLVMTREKMIDLAIADESLATDRSWASTCYDFGKRKGKYALAYKRYAVWMTKLFQPVEVIHAVEINDYLRGCGPGKGWDSVVAASNQTYDAIKQLSPETIVSPSFVLSPLYNDQVSGFNSQHYRNLSGLKRDRFAVSVYPQAFRLAGDKQPQPSDLPDDFLNRAHGINPSERPLVIAETGWNTRSLAFGTPDQCATTALPSDEATAVLYLDWLLAQAEKNQARLVTWWSHHDLLPQVVMATCYPEIGIFSASACKGEFHCLAINVFRRSFPKPVGELIYKIFGTMGLYDFEGRPKKRMLSSWQKALRRPFSPP